MFLQLYREIFVAIVPISRFFFTVLSKAFIESFGSCTDYILLGTNTSTFGGKKKLWILPKVICIQIIGLSAPRKLLKTSLVYEARSTSAFSRQFIPSSHLPSLCAAYPHNSRGWGGSGEGFSFLHLHRFSWKQLIGLSPDLTEILSLHSCSNRDPSLLVSGLGKCTGHCLWHLEDVSKERHATFPMSLFLPCTESSRLLF